VFFQEYPSGNPMRTYSMHLMISDPSLHLNLALSSNSHRYSLDHHHLACPYHLYPNLHHLSLVQSSHHDHQHQISFPSFSPISSSS